MSSMKIKAKETGGIVSVTVLLTHDMLTYDQAKAKGVDANFITHVNAKVGDKIVFDVSTSQFLAKNPQIKFKFAGKKDEDLTITWVDLSGATESDTKKIK